MTRIIKVGIAALALVACSDDSRSDELVPEESAEAVEAPPVGAPSAGGTECSGSRNACGGCGDITTVARDADVALSELGAKMMPGNECWFSREPGYLGPPVWGKLKCLTTTQFYCFHELERCTDGRDNDRDGQVDECEPGQTTDSKYGDVEPLQK